MLRSTRRGLETWHGRDRVTLADERARQQGTQTSTYTGAPVLDPTSTACFQCQFFCSQFVRFEQRKGGDRSRYCGGVPGPAYRNSPLSRPGWVIVPIPSTSVGADPEQDVDARVAMASSERGNQGQAAAKR